MCKVIYFHDLPFYEFKGGFYSPSFTDEYFERFLSAGFGQVIIVSRVIGSQSIPLGYNCLSAQSVVVSNAVGNGYRSILRPSAFADIFKLVRSGKLIVISTPSVNGLFASMLCLVLGRKFVCEVAGDYDAFNTKRFGSIITFCLKRYMPFLVRKAVGSTYVTNDLLAKYPNANAIVGSNVNIHNVFPRSDYSIKDLGEVSIGFVGGLVERKGIRTIIKAAALLKDRCSEVKYRFHFIGGHSDQDWRALSLELGVSDICLFHGMKTRMEIDALLDSFDLYVQPSFSEGVPRATIEAMSHGLPVIATTLPGFFEILPAEVLVSSGCVDILAEKIRYFAENESMRRKHGERNLERAKSFLFKDMNEERVCFYKGVLDLLKR